MPKLHIFAACEKVIVAQGENTVSLITLFRELKVQVSKGETPPGEAFVPHDWVAFSLWFRQNEDGDRVFQQYAALMTKDGDVLLKSPERNFSFLPGKTEFRIIERLPMFPIGRPGDLELKLFSREKGEEDWVETSLYPMICEYVPPEVTA